MFRMLIDTSVWLDLAKDPRQVPVLGVIEEMVKLGASPWETSGTCLTRRARSPNATTRISAP